MDSVVEQSPPGRRKSPWPFLLKAAVSIVLLWLTLRHVALRAVLAQMAVIDRGWVLAALLILAASTFVAAFRWSVILTALSMPRGLRVTYPLSLIGLFFGQALPSGVGGDVMRVWLGCRTGLTPRVAISSILGDRLTGLLAILLIVTLELPPIRAVLPDPAVFYGVLFTLAAGYAGIGAFLVLDRVPAALHRFRAVRGFAGVSADLRGLLRSPRVLLVMLCGAVIQFGNVLSVYALVRGFHLPAGLGGTLLVVPLANIVQSLPISIAGWGVREGFFVAAFALVGVAAPQALAISVIFGLLVIVSSLPGGLLWLFQSTGAPRNFREIAPE